MSVSGSGAPKPALASASGSRPFPDPVPQSAASASASASSSAARPPPPLPPTSPARKDKSSVGSVCISPNGTVTAHASASGMVKVDMNKLQLALMPAGAVLHGDRCSRRFPYSIKQRLEILRSLDECDTVEQQTRVRIKAGATTAMIAHWRKDRSLYEQHFKKAPNATRLPGGGKKPDTGSDELVLSEVFRRRSLLQAVCWSDIAQIARDFRAAACEGQDPATVKPFTGSAGYVDKFLRRHKFSLRMRTSHTQKPPKDLAPVVQTFIREVCAVVKRHNIQLCNIHNADETAVWFCMPKPRTIAPIGAKEVVIKHFGGAKKRITAMVSFNALGKADPLFVILKNPLGRVTVPRGMFCAANKKAWMTEALMLQWIDKLFLSWHIRNKAKPLHLREWKLLVLDKFSGHCTQTIRDRLLAYHIELLLIPPGCTRYLQPMDVVVNARLKALLRDKYSQWAVSPDRELKANKTPAGNQRCASKTELLAWAKAAIDQMGSEESQQSIARGFLKCGLSVSTDGKQNHLIGVPGLLVDEQFNVRCATEWKLETKTTITTTDELAIRECESADNTDPEQHFTLISWNASALDKFKLMHGINPNPIPKPVPTAVPKPLTSSALFNSKPVSASASESGLKLDDTDSEDSDCEPLRLKGVAVEGPEGGVKKVFPVPEITKVKVSKSVVAKESSSPAIPRKRGRPKKFASLPPKTGAITSFFDKTADSKAVASNSKVN